jgi:hypothetical protein
MLVSRGRLNWNQSHLLHSNSAEPVGKCFRKLATQRMNAFQRVIGHDGKLNIVFGGGNSFSHGVRIKSGKARFVLVSLTIQ